MPAFNIACIPGGTQRYCCCPKGPTDACNTNDSNKGKLLHFYCIFIAAVRHVIYVMLCFAYYSMEGFDDHKNSATSAGQLHMK